MRRREPQHRVVDEARPDRVGLAAEDHAVAAERRLAQAKDVGIDPAVAPVPDHPVAEHVGEGRDRRLAVGDEPASQRFVGADRARVLEADAGRQLEARIVAEDPQARAGLSERGEARVSERIERPVPEGREFAAVGGGAARSHGRKRHFLCSPEAHSILARTFRPASSQSPKNVSVVKSPSETNSQ